MKNKRGQLILTVILCVILFVSILSTFIYPYLYEYQCKTRHFDEFENGITNDILESNIVIVKYEEKTSGNVTSFSYSAGASGVIFYSEDDTYYALTAYHVVKDVENVEYIVMPYGAPTYLEYRKNNEVYITSEEFYGQFETAQILYADEEYDLAVITFKSEKKLSELSISEKNPKYNEKIAVISNPDGERFVHSYGTIRSKDYYVFNSDDELLPAKTFKHNAYESHGSSGSAVLNQEMQIVGINIGGGTDFLHRFKYGAMVPCELIYDFFEKYNIK